MLTNFEYPYFYKKNPSTDIFFMDKLKFTGPPRRAGEGLLIIDPINMMEKGRRAWAYLPGQRRVKRAPDVAHDTPSPTTSGTSTYDDTYIFNGSMERFDFKLIGKKEMYIPYNCYKLVYQSTANALCQPNFANPDYGRWERHRVWVVEASLKPGKRHLYSKRIFYIDEDSWAAVASDQYDGRGQLYRGSLASPAFSYDAPAPFQGTQIYYDLISNSYGVIGLIADKDGYLKYVDPLPPREWAPASLAGTGIR